MADRDGNPEDSFSRITAEMLVEDKPVLTMIAFNLNLPIIDISPDKNFNSNGRFLLILI